MITSQKIKAVEKCNYGNCVKESRFVLVCPNFKHIRFYVCEEHYNVEKSNLGLLRDWIVEKLK